VEDEASAGGGGGVERFLQRAEADAALAQVGDNLGGGGRAAGASAASLATDLELSRAEVKALREERDRLKKAVQRGLGAQLDHSGTREDELAPGPRAEHRLQRELADAQDEVVAVREAGRQMFKNVNRST
jgi:hypothetical protein